MFVSEQDLQVAFLNAGYSMIDAHNLALEAKLELMFNDNLTIEEVVSNLLSKKGE